MNNRLFDKIKDKVKIGTIEGDFYKIEGLNYRFISDSECIELSNIGHPNLLIRPNSEIIYIESLYVDGLFSKSIELIRDEEKIYFIKGGSLESIFHIDADIYEYPFTEQMFRDIKLIDLDIFDEEE